jgi:hypothetical protein
MFKKLLILTLLIGCLWGQSQAVTIQGTVQLPGTTQGIPFQWVVLFINAGTSSFADSVQTDSIGFFSQTYTFNPASSQGDVTSLYICNGTAIYDSAFWSSPNATVTLSMFCGTTPAPTGRFICGIVQPLTASDTVILDLFRLVGGSFVNDTSMMITDSSGTGFASYCLRAQNTAAQYQLRASLTLNSASYSSYVPTWYGNTANQSQATTIIHTGSGNVQLQPLVLQPILTNSIFMGMVTGNTNPNPAQIDTIQLILIEVQNNMWTPVDTFYILDSMGIAPFYRTTALSGTYSLLASIVGSNAANFVPTYFGNATTWSAASTFNLSAGTTVVVSIALQAAGGTGSGGGSAGGGVNQGGLPITGSTGMPGVQLQLHNPQGQALKAVHTNTQGVYNMSNLAFGDYKMHVELMGIPFTAYPFSLSSSNPNVQLHFTVNGESIAASLEQAGFKLTSVYPNPAREVLTISLSSQTVGKLQIQLLDMSGRKVLGSDWQLAEGEGSKQLSLDGIPAGIYLLELRNNNSFAAQRIVIQ